LIERAEKQLLLAKNARKLVDLLDDTPVVPGDERAPFAQSEQARNVLNSAEADLRNWEASYDHISSQAGALGSNAVPQNQAIQQDHLQLKDHDGTTSSSQWIQRDQQANTVGSGITSEQQQEQQQQQLPVV